jgi:S1-C subfamily serine protease
VILRVDGERVADVEAFYRALWARPVGRAIELGLWRDGAPATGTVVPADRYRVFEFRGR